MEEYADSPISVGDVIALNVERRHLSPKQCGLRAGAADGLIEKQ
jgi:hypothetical protein